jgi:uncharacterized membrane protein YphA (DoxX/SURF4 family)
MSTDTSTSPTNRSAAVSSLVDNFAERVRGHIVGVMRIVAGVLWLANLEWKRPPDFGRNAGNGLYKYVDSAVRLPVFGPYSWFVEHVVLKHYRVFGWATLTTEVVLAVCLLLGFHTRLAALLGAVMSVNILLSVLNYDKAAEWPWSYYLMIALHLMLFAVGAGRLSIDGLRGGSVAHRARAVRALGVVAVIVGIVGVVSARGGAFAAKQGHIVGYAKGNWELKLIWLNVLSALLTIAFGMLAVAGASFRRSILSWIAALGFALMSLQVLLQWRVTSNGWTGGFLGGTGGTLAFWVMLAVGVGTCLKPGPAAT